MNRISIFIPIVFMVLIGCSESQPAAAPAKGATIKIDFDPKDFPEEPPEIEPEGGYSGLAALIESRNATPKRVQEMLDLGSDVMELGERGWTPLHWAASNSRNPEVISLLLEAGADVNAKAGGLTPLHCAAMVNPNPKVTLMLLEAGAEVNANLDSFGNPLYMACSSSQKNPGIILLLLAKGADANTRNFTGQTPLDFARKNQSLEGTEALKALKSATSFWNR